MTADPPHSRPVRGGVVDADRLARQRECLDQVLSRHHGAFAEMARRPVGRLPLTDAIDLVLASRDAATKDPRHDP
jgi:hypothetical protein